ncbi:MAG TPA: hypothetical protein VEX68_05010 [Bryobacteraceae bacterium]|nr:hypothetical protein [Bryobacteraceae bacterium]
MPDLDWRSISVLAVVVLAWLTKSVWEPFLKAYSEEKGKRKATHEDIENVLAELRVITAETKAIEAKISGGEWDRQWLKTERVKRYAEYLLKLEAFMSAIIPAASKLRAGTHCVDELTRFNSAASELDRLHWLVWILADDEMQKAIQEINTLRLEVAAVLSSSSPDEATVLSGGPYGTKLRVLISAMRNELQPK